MNVRKHVDYSAMFTALDTLMAADLPQMVLYCEIGRLISARSEKGAAVAAAEYLSDTHPDASGFSPRNLRRMREFYRSYESAPEVLADAMTIKWTQNVIILESDLAAEDRAWYIRAARRFGWSKLELQREIAAAAHLELVLDFEDGACYNKKDPACEEASTHAAAEEHQCHGTGDPGLTVGRSAGLHLLCPEVFSRGIYSQPVQACGWGEDAVGMANGTGQMGRRDMRQALFRESGLGQPGVVSRFGELSAQRLRFRHPLLGWPRRIQGKTYHGRASPGESIAAQVSEAFSWIRRRGDERPQYGGHQSANADVHYSP